MTASSSERCRNWRKRRARGSQLATVEVMPDVQSALVRLGLLPDDATKHDLACAVEAYLRTAPAMVDVGKRLYPEPLRRDDVPCEQRDF